MEPICSARAFGWRVLASSVKAPWTVRRHQGTPGRAAPGPRRSLGIVRAGKTLWPRTRQSPMRRTHRAPTLRRALPSPRRSRERDPRRSGAARLPRMRSRSPARRRPRIPVAALARRRTAPRTSPPIPPRQRGGSPVRAARRLRRACPRIWARSLHFRRSPSAPRPAVLRAAAVAAVGAAAAAGMASP